MADILKSLASMLFVWTFLHNFPVLSFLVASSWLLPSPKSRLLHSFRSIVITWIIFPASSLISSCKSLPYSSEIQQLWARYLGSDTSILSSIYIRSSKPRIFTITLALPSPLPPPLLPLPPPLPPSLRPFPLYPSSFCFFPSFDPNLPRASFSHYSNTGSTNHIEVSL